MAECTLTIGVAIPCYYGHIQQLMNLLSDINKQSKLPDMVEVSLSSTDQGLIDKYLNNSTIVFNYPMHIQVTSESLNPAQNRNIAMSKLNTDIISFFDADDVMHPQRLQHIHKVFLKFPEVGLVLHSYYQNEHMNLVDEPDPQVMINVIRHNYPSTPTGKDLDLPIHNAHTNINTKVIGKQLFNEDIVFKFREDSEYNSRLLRDGVKCAYINAKLSLYYPSAFYNKKKVVSFSLWGGDPKYNIGAIKNVELASIFYPDFECWFYVHKESVPSETVQALEKFNNVKIIFKEGNIDECKPMCWRFETIDNPCVGINLSRDLDSRISLREKLATDQWIASGKTFHIMRDHPWHYYTPIMGGMFGTKKITSIPSWKQVMTDSITQSSHREYDQTFLSNFIFPHIKDECLVHSSFEKDKQFPIQYCSNYNFVGEYVNHDESRPEEHKNILKNSYLQMFGSST